MEPVTANSLARPTGILTSGECDGCPAFSGELELRHVWLARSVEGPSAYSWSTRRLGQCSADPTPQPSRKTRRCQAWGSITIEMLVCPGFALGASGQYGSADGVSELSPVSRLHFTLCDTSLLSLPSAAAQAGSRAARRPCGGTPPSGRSRRTPARSRPRAARSARERVTGPEEMGDTRRGRPPRTKSPNVRCHIFILHSGKPRAAILIASAACPVRRMAGS